MLKFRQLVIILLCALPALGMLTLIIHYAVNVPVTDQYALIHSFQQLDAGRIPFGDFWAQHNEHRIVFPTIILVFMGKLTHWNILAEIYLSFAIACASFIALAQLAMRHVQNQTFKITAIFLAGCFFFSPAQWENWIWGWQLEWYLCIASILWSVNLLDKIKDKEKLTMNWFAPVFLAIIATFSLGSGFLVWALGTVVLVAKRFKTRLIATWITPAILSLGLYYFQYHKPENGLSSTSFLYDIPRFIRNYLAYLGRPVSDDARVATFVGLYVLIIYVVLVAFVIYRKELGRRSAIISVGLLGLAAGVLTGMARFDYGIAGALSSRYTAFSGLVIISVIVLAMSMLSTLKNVKKQATIVLTIATLLIVLPAVGYSWRNGLNGLRTRSIAFQYIYDCSREANPTHACLYEIYFPDTDQALTMLNYLKQKHYGGY